MTSGHFKTYSFTTGETMTEGHKAEYMVRECVKEWDMERTDAEGHSGGTLTAWSPDLKTISVNRFRVVLGT